MLQVLQTSYCTVSAEYDPSFGLISVSWSFSSYVQRDPPWQIVPHQSRDGLAKPIRILIPVQSALFSYRCLHASW